MARGTIAEKAKYWLEPETELAANYGLNRKELSDIEGILMNAIIAALDAHTTVSTQALESERVREGLRDVLLGPAQLYENLRRRQPAE